MFTPNKRECYPRSSLHHADRLLTGPAPFYPPTPSSTSSYSSHRSTVTTSSTSSSSDSDAETHRIRNELMILQDRCVPCDMKNKPNHDNHSTEDFPHCYPMEAFRSWRRGNTDKMRTTQGGGCGMCGIGEVRSLFPSPISRHSSMDRCTISIETKATYGSIPGELAHIERVPL